MKDNKPIQSWQFKKRKTDTNHKKDEKTADRKRKNVGIVMQLLQLM